MRGCAFSQLLIHNFRLYLEPLYKRGLVIQEKALGPEHPVVATSLNNLAGLYRAQGQYAQAELFYKRALAIQEKAAPRLA
jgi:tetratricopeptide (TPR) repeat protein